MPEVLVVGGVNHDLVVHAHRRPLAGETVVGSGPVTRAGGKGANIAVAAAAAGAEVALCAAVGRDAVGDEQIRELQRSGVDTTHVSVVPAASTGVALIVVTDDGENSIVVGPGANAELGADDVNAAGAAGNAVVVVAQTEPGAAVVDAAARVASRTAARFIINAAPVLRLEPMTLAAADPLVVNEHEALDLQKLLGTAPVDESLSSAHRLLAELGCRSVVVSMGAEGAQVVAPGIEVLVAAPAVDVTDTTGAGDVLVGTIAAGLAAGATLVDATRAACRAASEAVRTTGARGYLDEDGD